MKITPQLILSILGFFVALLSVSAAIYFGLKNNKRSEMQDTKSEAFSQAIIEVKLDTIVRDVGDIKRGSEGIEKSVLAINERLIRSEESTKSAHHRIDEIKEILERNKVNL